MRNESSSPPLRVLVLLASGACFVSGCGSDAPAVSLDDARAIEAMKSSVRPHEPTPSTPPTKEGPSTGFRSCLQTPHSKPPPPPAGVKERQLIDLYPHRDHVSDPDEATLASLAAGAGKTRINVCVYFCVQHGTMIEEGVTIRRSSGVPKIDELAVNVVRGWKFKPFPFDDRTSKYCSEAIFNRDF